MATLKRLDKSGPEIGPQGYGKAPILTQIRITLPGELDTTNGSREDANAELALQTISTWPLAGMSGICPNIIARSLMSARIVWKSYFNYVVEASIDIVRRTS